jgi:hypothetical protein
VKTLVSFAQFSVFHRLGLVRNLEIRDRGNFPAQLHEFRLTAPVPIGFSHSLGQHLPVRNDVSKDTIAQELPIVIPVAIRRVLAAMRRLF